MNVIGAILMLGLLVVSHEFGHFIIAKANGVRVKEFAIGFGPKIFGFKKGETEYTFNILPFGGACIMQGDLEDTAKDEVIDDDRSFDKKSVWARISILFAGPFFNFLLAFIFSVVILSTFGYQPATVYDIEEGSPAEEIGLQPGDEIVKINGRTIAFANEYDVYNRVYTDKTYNITYIRDGKKYKTTLVPDKRHEVAYRIGIVISSSPVMVNEVLSDSVAAKAGLKSGDIIKSINGNEVVVPSDVSKYFTEAAGAASEVVIERDGVSETVGVTPDKYEYDRNVYGILVYSPPVKGNSLTVVGKSVSQVRYYIMTVIDSFHMLFSGKVTSDDVAGPVGIVNIISEAASEGKKEGGIRYMILNVLYIAGLLSANLGVMNLLPIPALDGGRLLFCFIEAVRGKPVDKKKEGIVHLVGMACLMVLMVFILFNDIKNVFFK